LIGVTVGVLDGVSEAEVLGIAEQPVSKSSSEMDVRTVF